MKLSRKELNLPKYPERIIQFGEGNFLRCFIDWQIDILNKETDFNSGVVVVRPIDDTSHPSLNLQDGLYTTIIRGINEKGSIIKDSRIISSVNREIPVYQEFESYLALAHNPDMRFIFSNTTEAGITYDENDKYSDLPPSTYPAKLTRLLHERFTVFSGDKSKGFILLPCELIDYNGEQLKEIVLKYANLWELGEEFAVWLVNSNVWCSTLVDRIVTGYPYAEKDELVKELGYTDKFMTTGEHFYLFVIQGPKDILNKELKLEQVNLNILITNNLEPFKTRKVGILNGAHTSMVPVAYLYGIKTVKDAIENKDINKFVNSILEKEIIPSLNMDKNQLLNFKEDVIRRFRNPYVHHLLLNISLNSMSKYKTRVLPQLLTYYNKFEVLPKDMLFSLAALIRFYKGVDEQGENIDLKDNKEFLELYSELWKNNSTDYKHIVETVLGLSSHWEIDLNTIPRMTDLVTSYLKNIDTLGVKEALKEIK